MGFASFISALGTSIAMAFINRGLGNYGGTAAITFMGAINSLYTFFLMPIMGVTQGIQPIIGYNYGAKETKRVYLSLRYGLGISVIFSTVVFLLLELFPAIFIGMFLDPGSETNTIAVNGLRIFVLALPFLAINLMGVAYFQSTAKGKISIVLVWNRKKRKIQESVMESAA